MLVSWTLVGNHGEMTLAEPQGFCWQSHQLTPTPVLPTMTYILWVFSLKHHDEDTDWGEHLRHFVFKMWLCSNWFTNKPNT